MSPYIGAKCAINPSKSAMQSKPNVLLLELSLETSKNSLYKSYSFRETEIDMSNPPFAAAGSPPLGYPCPWYFIGEQKKNGR